MKKLKSTLPNMILSLGCITILSGFLLGLMYMVTKKPIDESAVRRQNEAVDNVLPPHDNNPLTEMTTVSIGTANFEIYPATAEGQLVGAAVKGETMSGFSGLIEIIVGFDADGSIRDYSVLQHSETPGLGAKMQTWFRDPTAARSVIGKSPLTSKFYPSKDGGDIDAITAATISSRAFLGIVRDACEAYRQYAASKGLNLTATENDAHTGASQHHNDNQLSK